MVIHVHGRAFAVECLFRLSHFTAILPAMIRALDSLRGRPSGPWMARIAVLAALLLSAVEAGATRGVLRGRGLDLAGVRDHESLDASGGIGGLLAIRERVETGPETTRYVISDPQGNVMALADPAGTLVARFDYDSFGRLIMETGEAGSCPFRYSTKYRDPDLELSYYGHRWYDPSAMKWLTPDPIGERGGVNLTAFCGNDPVNKVDPLGLYSWEDFRADYMTKEAWQYRGKIFAGTFVGAGKALYGVGRGTFIITAGGIHAYTGWDCYSQYEDEYLQVGENLVSFATHPIQTTKQGVQGWQASVTDALLAGDGLAVGENVGSASMQALIVGETVVNPGARLLARAPGRVGALGVKITQPVVAFPTVESLLARVVPPKGVTYSGRIFRYELRNESTPHGRLTVTTPLQITAFQNLGEVRSMVPRLKRPRLQRLDTTMRCAVVLLCQSKSI